jgi:hypothetical protein
MSKYFSIKSGGFPLPKGVSVEQWDHFITSQPAEYLDSPAEMEIFEKIYGPALAAAAVKTRRVPENVTESWLMAGIHYTVGSDPVIVPIPAPGEPAWLKRIEAKLDLILDKL